MMQAWPFLNASIQGVRTVYIPVPYTGVPVTGYAESYPDLFPDARADVRALQQAQPGATYHLQISFANTGNVPTYYYVEGWISPAATNIATPLTGTFTTATPVVTPSIPVGGSASPTLLIPAPATPGTYGIFVRLSAIQDTGQTPPTVTSTGWTYLPIGASPSSAITGPLDTVAVGFISPTEVATGLPTAPVTFNLPFSFTLTFTNPGSGTVDWRLNVWVDNPNAPGNALTQGSGPSFPPYTATGVAPGGSHPFTVVLVAPTPPGTYNLKAHLYEELSGVYTPGSQAWINALSSPALANADAQGNIVIGQVTVPTTLGASPTITLASWT